MYVMFYIIAFGYVWFIYRFKKCCVHFSLNFCLLNLLTAIQSLKTRVPVLQAVLDRSLESIIADLAYFK